MMQVAVLRADDERPPRAPQAGDGVAEWFEPMLAGRLVQAGLPTLAALAGRINEAGARWWYPVRGLGATKAARIGEWLQARQGETGLAVRLPVRPAQAQRPHAARDLAWRAPRPAAHPFPPSFTT